MAKTKKVEKPQVLSTASEIAQATEAETRKGSQRESVTAWVDSNSSIEFLVPEWFLKVVTYDFNAQPADTMKGIGSEVVTPATSAADKAKILSGLKIKGGTKIIGSKVTIPTPKAEAGKQGEVFGEFSYAKNGKTIKVSRRGFRVPGVLSNRAIQYWLYTCSTLKPAYFIRGSYKFPVGTLAAAPDLASLGTAHKGVAAA
jgi:hypothetical protein